MSSFADAAPASSPSPSAPFAAWIQALRLISITASVVPVVFGVVLAWPSRDAAGAWLWLPALLGGVFLQLGTNLTNDVGDFRSGVDQRGISEGSGVLTQGLLSAAQMARAAYLCFGLGVLLGLPVAAVRGWPLLALGAVGLLGGWGYTAGPRYKYLGLGDLCVFFLMGPLMVAGGQLAVSGSITPAATLWVSLPIGFWVVAIIHANNLRDSEADAAAGVNTVARALGRRGSLAYLDALVLGADAAVIALVVTHQLPWEALAPLLTLPWQFRLLASAARAVSPEAKRAALLVESTAQLHLLFGLLLALGTGLGLALHR